MDGIDISREAADQCASACRRFADGVADLQNVADRIPDSTRFGTLPSGVALQKKYSELAVGGPGSLSAMLQAHITVATNLATTFTQIGRNYEATDAAVAQTITTNKPTR